jgi:steroid delta-isomerase-like uncharacterized protein
VAALHGVVVVITTTLDGGRFPCRRHHPFVAAKGIDWDRGKGILGRPERAVTAEENKALVRRWFAEIDRGNMVAVDELIAIDYVDHNPPIPSLPPGREGIRQASLILRRAFPNVIHTIEEQLAEGDKVMTRVATRATFTGEFLGFPPTGQVVEITGIAVHRIADGMLVEHWAHVDMAGFMQQIGDPVESTHPPSRD